MTEVLDPQSDVRYALEWRSEPGWTELRCALRELLGGVDPTERVVALRHLKEKVLRLEFAPGTPWRSVVVKRLEPAVAQRNQRSEEHTSELPSPCNLVCRLLLEKKKDNCS